MGQYRILRGRVNSVGFLPDERLIPYLELAGFGSAALFRTFDLRYDLISALVERWRPETHTFHLPCGECTITLEDVALQLGLPIDGNVVTGISLISRQLPFAMNYLDARQVNFEHLSSIVNEWEVMQAARAYIMHLIGGVLMPDANGSMVHLIWSTNQGIERSYTAPIYRLMIENHAGEGFVWMSYFVSEIMVVIPSSAHVHSNLWCISALVINFHIVEWYHGDRVLRQFGCIQYILTLPVQLGDIHGMSKRGAYGNNWGEVHEEYITMWNN
ncbi:hypothetical protein PVK06_039290 [Gossypium arboreum]|uniref:Aminotransferase-like plant mobile domain-containing protein n=1 Tax=Gossypium arboreum TaxID=29729 RepID=A0ABR0N2J4_GOSAR|nr:hypothetical protein PVK06_039290 [Gossypium arboreum]